MQGVSETMKTAFKSAGISEWLFDDTLLGKIKKAEANEAIFKPLEKKKVTNKKFALTKKNF